MSEPGAPAGRCTVEHLSPVEKTLLVTLIGRAQDNRKETPFLGDPLATDVLRRIDYDRDRVKIGSTITLAAAIRSSMLDRAVREYIAEHPGAVVVEMGSGLETRRHRVTPGPEVDWYDVDFPDVAELRRQLLPHEDQGRAHLVGADITDPRWLDGIATDRPTIVVADGLLGFLDEAQAQTLFTGITDHFEHGELVFNAYTRLVAKTVGMPGLFRELGIPKGYRGFGFDEPHYVEKIVPKLNFVEERFGTQEQLDKMSWTLRITAALFTRWTAQARRGAWVVRYRF